jgi:serine/threonine protein phosphatase 1
MHHYVIGDVHGYYQTLMKLVEKLPENTTLVFVGDLIDMGMAS